MGPVELDAVSAEAALSVEAVEAAEESVQIVLLLGNLPHSSNITR